MIIGWYLGIRWLCWCFLGGLFGWELGLCLRWLDPLAAINWMIQWCLGEWARKPQSWTASPIFLVSKNAMFTYPKSYRPINIYKNGICYFPTFLWFFVNHPIFSKISSISQTTGRELHRGILRSWSSWRRSTPATLRTRCHGIWMDMVGFCQVFSTDFMIFMGICLVHFGLNMMKWYEMDEWDTLNKGYRTKNLMGRRSAGENNLYKYGSGWYAHHVQWQTGI